MITITPLPAWGSLLAPLTGAAATDVKLAEPWLAPGSGDVQAVWFSRAAWAMQALVRWRQSLNGGEKPRLWLPGYFCNQSTFPAREAGARIVFYPVDMDLAPDWAQCRRMAAEAPPDLFILVHYFGAPADAAEAKAFCRETGALLVEDAAHVLRPVQGVGEKGDFVFYSPHKVLAVPDGALLLMRNKDGEDIIRAAAAGDSSRSGPWPGPWLAKRALQKVLPGPLLSRRARARRPAFLDDPPYQALPPAPRMSAMARAMLAGAAPSLASSLAVAAQARRDNWQVLRRSLDGLPACRPLEIYNDAAPYRFVLRCDDPETAAALFADFHRRGCPAESWPDLPGEVLADPELHKAALHLRRTLVMLPVHQTAAAGELVSCCGNKN
ncbi:MAG TPA: hypothetical protein ENI79_06020 [Rhodospirillales bacterium]|nr:hypothetical protein [Rhodospirillales bacterium]